MSVFSNLPERERFVCSKREPVLIFGTGSFGRSVARACAVSGIEVKAFIQTTPTAHTVDGIAVRSWADFSEGEKDLPLLIGIFNRDTPFDGLVALASSAGFHRIVLPYDIYAQFGTELGWRYWLSGPDLLQAHVNELNDIYELLADEESKNCLEQLVKFRLGLNLSYSSFAHREQQYFNSISLSRFKNSAIRYVDAGAYNGDSFLSLREVHEVSAAYLFEPDPRNFAALVSNLQSVGYPALCLPVGLAKHHELLRFKGSLGEAGHLDPQGEDGIMTAPLDDLLQGKSVDFIKLDIEGAELDAFLGMKRVLSTQAPNIAVSSYHRPQDLWALLKFLSGRGLDFRFYFRQHAFNSFDLVLYAVK
jgi:FkbM family methyltransferase